MQPCRESPEPPRRRALSGSGLWFLRARAPRGLDPTLCAGAFPLALAPRKLSLDAHANSTILRCH